MVVGSLCISFVHMASSGLVVKNVTFSSSLLWTRAVFVFSLILYSLPF